MHKVSVDDLDRPRTISPASVVRLVSRALDTTDVAINYYELENGDSTGFDYHRHNDQEEVFLIQEGTVTFRTEEGDVEVTEGEAIRFAPGEFQLARNEGTDRVRLFAVGAPAGTKEIEYLRPCSDCGEDTIQTFEVDRDTGIVTIRCEECETAVEEIQV